MERPAPSSIFWAFVLIFLGVTCSFYGQSYLYYDSADLFFTNIIGSKTFHLLPNRPSLYFFQWPTVLAVNLGVDHLNKLKFLYALPYVLYPLTMLLLCYFLLSKKFLTLLKWPFLAFGLGTIFFQVNIISEQLNAYYCFWPLFFLVYESRWNLRRSVLAILLASFMAGLHPIAFPLIMLLGFTSFLLYLKTKRKVYLVLIGVALLFFSLRFLRLLWIPESKDLEIFSLFTDGDNVVLATLRYLLQNPLLLLPLLGPWLVALTLYSMNNSKLLFHASVCFVLLANAIVLYFSGQTLSYVIELRFIKLAYFIPFYICAMVEIITPQKVHASFQPLLPAALSFFIISGMANFRWGELSQEFVSKIDNFPGQCVPRKVIGDDHNFRFCYGAHYYYLFKGENKPSRLILAKKSCQELFTKKNRPLPTGLARVQPQIMINAEKWCYNSEFFNSPLGKFLKLEEVANKI